MSERDKLSIIIPMRNEEPFVRRCLESVLSQLLDGQDVEILCVDGASTDATRAILLEYAKRDARVRIVDNPDGAVPHGMNRALGCARGEVIMRLDSHSEYAADYIPQCLSVLARTGADNVGGYMTTLPGSDTPTGRAIAAATSSRFGVGGSAFRTGGDECEVDTVPFGCFRRNVFARVGGYDERLIRNQDIELNHRIRKHGGRIVISPAIKLTYFTRSTFAGLRQQAFFNGLWNPYTIWLVGGGLRPRHFVPLGFVLSIVLLGAGGFLWWPLWWLLAAELAVYLAAAAYFAGRTARQTRSNRLLVVWSFINLHLAYGLGSLWGVVTAPLKFGFSRQPVAPRVLPDRRD